MAKYRVDLAAMEWTHLAEGVRFKCYQEGGRQLRLVEFSKGFVEADWCLKGHIGYVLEGDGRLELAGCSVVLGPGDGIFIPPGELHKHKLVVLTDHITVVLVEELA